MFNSLSNFYGPSNNSMVYIQNGGSLIIDGNIFRGRNISKFIVFDIILCSYTATIPVNPYWLAVKSYIFSCPLLLGYKW